MISKLIIYVSTFSNILLWNLKWWAWCSLLVRTNVLGDTVYPGLEDSWRSWYSCHACILEPGKTHDRGAHRATAHGPKELDNDLFTEHAHMAYMKYSI